MRTRAIAMGAVLLLAAAGTVVPAGERGDRQIPVRVTGRVLSGEVQPGQPIPLEITIRNGFTAPIYFLSWDLKPMDGNGETPNIALFDIYRGSRPEGLYLGRPEVDPPFPAAAMPPHRIGPGQSLVLTTDASKWEIADGWLPGRYRLSVRIDNLQVDGFSAISVLGDPVEFEIPEDRLASGR